MRGEVRQHLIDDVPQPPRRAPAGPLCEARAVCSDLHVGSTVVGPEAATDLRGTPDVDSPASTLLPAHQNANAAFSKQGHAAKTRCRAWANKAPTCTPLRRLLKQRPQLVFEWGDPFEQARTVAAPPIAVPSREQPA